MITPDSREYNHGYLKAKAAQAARHEQAHGPTAESDRLPSGQIKTEEDPRLYYGTIVV